MIDSGLTHRIGYAARVAHQPTRGDDLGKLINRRHPVTECQSAKLCAATVEEGIATDRQRADFQLDQGRKGRLEVGLGARPQDVEP